MLHLSVACAHQNRISTDSAQVASHVIHRLELEQDRLKVIKGNFPGSIGSTPLFQKGLKVLPLERKFLLICGKRGPKLPSKGSPSRPPSVQRVGELFPSSSIFVHLPLLLKVL